MLNHHRFNFPQLSLPFLTKRLLFASVLTNSPLVPFVVTTAPILPQRGLSLTDVVVVPKVTVPVQHTLSVPQANAPVVPATRYYLKLRGNALLNAINTGVPIEVVVR
jgi:hypothetical protein